MPKYKEVTRLLIITIILLLAVVSYGQKKQKSLETDSVSYYIANNDFEKAIQLLNEEIKNNPSAELYISRGLVKLETNNLDDALSDYRKTRVYYIDE